MGVRSYLNTVKKMNDKTYPQINAHDRFKLVIKAYADNDDDQRERLVKTCPKVQYKISEPSYTERVEISRDILTAFLLQYLECEKIIIFWQLSEHEKEGQSLESTKKRFSQIYGFLLAFEKFCAEYFELDYKVLLQAWHPKSDYIERIERCKTIIQSFVDFPDEKTKNEWFNEVYVNAWNKRIK